MNTFIGYSACGDFIDRETFESTNYDASTNIETFNSEITADNLFTDLQSISDKLPLKYENSVYSAVYYITLACNIITPFLIGSDIIEAKLGVALANVYTSYNTYKNMYNDLKLPNYLGSTFDYGFKTNDTLKELLDRLINYLKMLEMVTTICINNLNKSKSPNSTALISQAYDSDTFTGDKIEIISTNMKNCINAFINNKLL